MFKLRCVIRCQCTTIPLHIYGLNGSCVTASKLKVMLIQSFSSSSLKAHEGFVLGEEFLNTRLCLFYMTVCVIFIWYEFRIMWNKYNYQVSSVWWSNNQNISHLRLWVTGQILLYVLHMTEAHWFVMKRIPINFTITKKIYGISYLLLQLTLQHFIHRLHCYACLHC